MLPSSSALFLFLTATVILLIIPGPAVFYIVGRSIGHGRTAGLVSVLGIGAGTFFHVAAAALGISALLASSAAAFQIVKYLGAAYLIFLGVRKLTTKENLGSSNSATQQNLRRIFVQGVVVQVLNPKTALFFLAFLPQFVSSERGKVTEQILFLGILFAVLGMLSDSVWALLAGTISNRLRDNSRWMDRQRYVSGGLLISLGLATAFSGTGRAK
jgi:threonine/homoserine/homoserine lactone efflux protein